MMQSHQNMPCARLIKQPAGLLRCAIYPTWHQVVRRAEGLTTGLPGTIHLERP
jgi:hypothetical protein